MPGITHLDLMNWRFATSLMGRPRPPIVESVVVVFWNLFIDNLFIYLGMNFGLTWEYFLLYLVVFFSFLFLDYSFELRYVPIVIGSLKRSHF